ncbi:hypothetical protein MK079_05285, partial [Candidatus Gracilibacteria bacterium]|nr:hypothetical protein [Candidatus Gracilibacteria bacterium]
VHKTYVYITPEIKIETRSANFVFSREQNESIFDSENTIRLQQHTGSIQLEKSFGTTGISESSIQKSSGSAILFNHLDTPIDLKIHTRVQNEAGIVYTLRDAYRLAAASYDTNGQIVASETPVDIVAKNYDIYGGFIGSRGNIGSDVSLILPGLPEHLQSKIYAKTAGNVSGGTDTYTTTLEAEDIKKAKQILENQLRSELMKQMKKDITSDNTLNNTSNEILTLHEMIEYGMADIRISDGRKIGDEISEFNLIGNMDITLYTFDKQLIVNKLKKVVSDTIFEESEALLLIDKDSLRISHVLSTQKNQSEIKATSEVEILVQYNFLNSEDSFVHKLKHTIASMEIGTAESMLRNNEKIQDVEIKNRPFFMGKITHIPRNIIFRIQED